MELEPREGPHGQSEFNLRLEPGEGAFVLEMLTAAARHAEMIARRHDIRPHPPTLAFTNTANRLAPDLSGDRPSITVTPHDRWVLARAAVIAGHVAVANGDTALNGACEAAALALSWPPIADDRQLSPRPIPCSNNTDRIP